MDAERRMTALSEDHPGERRRYWLSFAALAIVLPAAILVSSWSSLSEWRRSHTTAPLIVERGAIRSYAGAQWQLTGLTRVRTGLPGEILIVAEFEAAVDDPELLRNGPCQVVLTDDRGRRWLPAFIPARIVRQVLPATVDKPRCSALAKAEHGHKIAMAETFTIPENATGLALAVTAVSARPEFLIFKY